MSIRKKITILFLAAGIIGSFFYYFKNEILSLGAKLPKIQRAADIFIGEIKKEISTPPPLRATREIPETVLTSEGVVKFTNMARAGSGLSSLTVNAKLNASAELKAKDMFARQYFEHVSPNGEDISDLAEDVDYKYLLIGENLALGNFEDDEALVRSWMESPGHRENILNSKYKEIGVAVLKGTLEGRVTRIAVQHFGLPESACPLPEVALKNRIDANKAQLDVWAEDLEVMKAELEATKPKRGPEYREKVKQYNELAEAYNKLLEETRVFIAEYNKQIEESNKCKES